ncbi:MAG TPA: 2-hydroxychromene-2-carboxylate isomerase [Thermodesulfobacteriota bacterium]
MSKKVEFYYDFSSPYSYLASTKIEGICTRHGAELDWRPFLVGGVYKETGNRAPLEVPSKKRYMIQDVKDWANHYGVELNFPDLFPVNSVKSMRGAFVAKEQGRVRDYTHKLFKFYWIQNDDISQDEILQLALTELDMDYELFIKRINDQEIKDQLRIETAEAVRRGAFGAPTIFLGDKMFWGNDRLLFVESYLKSKL